MRNFLIDQNFDQNKADFIVNYAFRFGMVDVLHLKDLGPKIPLKYTDFFWKELERIPQPRLERFGKTQERLKMLIAWAQNEFRIRESLGISMSWDGVAQVNIEEFVLRWEKLDF